MRAQNNEKAFFRDEERNFIIPDECGKTQTTNDGEWRSMKMEKLFAKWNETK